MEMFYLFVLGTHLCHWMFQKSGGDNIDPG